MKKSLTYTVFIDMIFILLLTVSGFFSGVISDVLYYAAFLLPVIIFIPLFRKLGGDCMRLGFKPRGSDLITTLILSPSVIAIVFFLALLTAFLSNAVGKGAGGTDVSGSLLSVIIIHALLPALLEELLFRYVPISLMGGVNKPFAVIFSSILFALAHCDIFKLPYAFLAGAVFATLTVALGTVWPAVLLHFLNNSASIIWQKYAVTDTQRLIFLGVLLSLAAVSVCVIIVKKRKLIDEIIKPIFSEKCKFEFTKELALFAVLTLFIAVTSLI